MRKPIKGEICLVPKDWGGYPKYTHIKITKVFDDCCTADWFNPESPDKLYEYCLVDSSIKSLLTYQYED